ncbi:hypothetical protein CHRY9390_02889 [Chryseobacterium aquaeductus]|uniref:Uncharacterized protein n=1 Tax=Chryseobacterium aquaeductus TaxID=2675056 RepID=A0A9N8MQR7_9FLAO|nr:hypothetical protein CHRY9390_02889 [Chryseobacterium potabilaquae]CAD7814939.1 hypothetical protein CHRY9390_02889 [Chryseobacterium aquaeductus]
MISKNGVPTKKMENCNARKAVSEVGLILSEGTH